MPRPFPKLLPVELRALRMLSGALDLQKRTEDELRIAREDRCQLSFSECDGDAAYECVDARLKAAENRATVCDEAVIQAQRQCDKSDRLRVLFAECDTRISDAYDEARADSRVRWEEEGRRESISDWYHKPTCPSHRDVVDAMLEGKHPLDLFDDEDESEESAETQPAEMQA